ncbi:MAG: TonB-dependent receptor [Alkalinema sp. CAN_BIN05]|nr:TonB-dependent receptor [Alkalinema sp. CAN_BIN05]
MSLKLSIHTIGFSSLLLLSAPVLSETAIVRTQDFPKVITQADALLAQPALAQQAESIEEELVVTGKKDKPTSTPVYKINQDEIKKQGNRSVSEVLKNQPGFAINDAGFAADIHTGGSYRGASINQSIYLLNGRPIGTNVNTYHGNIDLNSIPTSTIDRIELSSGSASTLYGSEAFGGVINIITKPGNQKPKLTLGVTLGSFGQQNYRAGYAGSSQGFDYAFGWEQGRADNNYDVPVGAANRGRDGKLFNADTANNAYYARISAALDPRNTLTFDTTKTTSQKGLIYFGFPLQNDRLDHDAYNIGLNWRSELAKDSILNITLGYNRDYFNTYGPNGTSFYRTGDVDSQALTFRLDHDWQVAKGIKLRWGTDIKNESLSSSANSNNPTNAVFNGRIDQSRFLPSLFALGTFDLASNLQAELGLRQNFSDRAGSSLNPSLGLNWAATKIFNLRGSWVSVRRLPGLDQLYAYDTVHGWLPNDQLKPEFGSSWTLGTDVKFNDKFTGQFTYFGSSLNDRIATQSTGVGRPSKWQNIGLVNTNGLEFTLQYKITPEWRTFLTYTYTDSRIASGVDTGRQLNQIPFSVAQLGVGYERKGWQVNLLTNYYSGSRRSFFLNPGDGSDSYSPSWLNVDVNTRVPFTPQIGMTFYVQNLFGGTYEKTNRIYEPSTTFRVALEAEL